MSNFIHPPGFNALPLADAIVLGAYETQKAAVKLWKKYHRLKRGAALRPGVATPFWN